MDIQYGIKITTKNTTVTDYNLGIISGVIRWSTGRSDLGEFKNGIVLKDSFLPVSQEIEISACGSYSTMSAFSLKIDNAQDLVDTIRDLGLNLYQAETVLYCFRRETSEDPWEETEDWTGKLREWSYDENEIQISFMDGFRGIHKARLTAPLSIANFTNAPKSSVGTPIPVCFGYVNRAKLLPIGGPVSKVDLVSNGGFTFQVCAAQGVLSNANKTLSLYNEGISFLTNDPIIVGKYLNVISGGVSQFRKIISNIATASNLTSITVENPIDVSTPFVAWSPSILSPPTLWLFEVVEQSFSSIVSKNEIKSFESNDDSLISLFIYDEESCEYLDVAEVQISRSLDNIDGTGSPGFGIATNLDSDGKFSAYFPIRPSSIKFQSLGIADTWDGNNTFQSEQPNLFDGDPDTYYTLVGNELEVIAYFPEGGLKKTFDDIYVLFNATHRITSGSGSNRSIEVTVRPIDIYLTYSDATGLPTNEVVYFSNNNPDPVLTTSFQDFFLLPGVYFNNSFDSDYFHRQKGNLSILPVIDSIVKAKAFPAISVNIEYSISTNEVRIKEIGFVGKRNIDVKTDAMYAKILGEVFSSNWAGRKTAFELIKNPAEVVESLIRDYDGKPEVIDIASFDILGNSTTGLLKDCFLGIQLKGDENSAELLNELAVFSFIGIVPKNNGKRAIKSWMDGDVVATHSDTNGTINENSIGEKKPTSLADVANEPLVNYGWNPGSEKFDAFLHITNIDADSFPLEATLDGSGVPLWKSYAVGYNDDEYEEGKENWDLCHLSYTKYGIIQKLPDEMSNAKWFPNIETDWELSATYNAAKAYMRKLCRWTPFVKDVVSYNLPNTAEHASLELLDRITFSDSTDRAGAEIDGWIVGKAIVPGLKKDYIKIDLMLEPDLGGLA